MTDREQLLWTWKKLDEQHRRLVLEVVALAHVWQMQGDHIDFGHPLLAVPRPSAKQGEPGSESCQQNSGRGRVQRDG